MLSCAVKAMNEGIVERGTFKVVLEREVPTDENLTPDRFVFALKSTEDVKLKCKARYVILQ